MFVQSKGSVHGNPTDSMLGSPPELKRKYKASVFSDAKTWENIVVDNVQKAAVNSIIDAFAEDTFTTGILKGSQFVTSINLLSTYTITHTDEACGSGSGEIIMNVPITSRSLWVFRSIDPDDETPVGYCVLQPGDILLMSDKARYLMSHTILDAGDCYCSKLEYGMDRARISCTFRFGHPDMDEDIVRRHVNILDHLSSTMTEICSDASEKVVPDCINAHFAHVSPQEFDSTKITRAKLVGKESALICGAMQTLATDSIHLDSKGGVCDGADSKSIQGRVLRDVCKGALFYSILKKHNGGSWNKMTAKNNPLVACKNRSDIYEYVMKPVPFYTSGVIVKNVQDLVKSPDNGLPLLVLNAYAWLLNENPDKPPYIKVYSTKMAAKIYDLHACQVLNVASVSAVLNVPISGTGNFHFPCKMIIPVAFCSDEPNVHHVVLYSIDATDLRSPTIMEYCPSSHWRRENHQDMHYALLNMIGTLLCADNVIFEQPLQNLAADPLAGAAVSNWNGCGCADGSLGKGLVAIIKHMKPFFSSTLESEFKSCANNLDDKCVNTYIKEELLMRGIDVVVKTQGVPVDHNILQLPCVAKAVTLVRRAIQKQDYKTFCTTVMKLYLTVSLALFAASHTKLMLPPFNKSALIKTMNTVFTRTIAKSFDSRVYDSNARLSRAKTSLKKVWKKDATLRSVQYLTALHRVQVVTFFFF